MTAVSDFLRFYWRCLALTFKGKLRLALLASTGALTVIVSLGILAFSPSQKLERFLIIDLPGIVFLAALVTTVVIGLVLAPFQIHREETVARAALKERLRPKLKVSLPEGGGPVGVNMAGSTSETFGGQRQTIIRSFVEAVYLACENIGEVGVHAARARVMAVVRRSLDGADTKMVESIELPWNREATSGSLSADIPPNESRRFWLGWVRSHGHFWVFRQRTELPIDYQQVFGPPGLYRVLIQVDSDDTAPIQALLEIETGEGPKPTGNGVWRGSARVALLEQASPRISSDWGFHDAGGRRDPSGTDEPR